MRVWRYTVLPMCAAILLHSGAGIASEPAYDPAVIDAIFRTYVDDQGMVDYQRLKDNRSALDSFVTSLGAFDPELFQKLPEPERIAFLVNAYNAITLQRIIDHYPFGGAAATNARFPVSSIRQIDGVWDRMTTRVLGRDMTLDYIEHEILRKEFREPRLHAALVCAADGCPPLRPEAYTGMRLNEQLDDQSKRFLQAPHRFRVDHDRKIVYLSPILKWYGKDFVGVYNRSDSAADVSSEIGAALDYVSRYVAPADAERIKQGGYRVEFLEYDWSLNEQK